VCWEIMCALYAVEGKHASVSYTRTRVHACTHARKHVSGVYTPTRRVDGSGCAPIRVCAYTRTRP
jgi:hypothetical protein